MESTPTSAPKKRSGNNGLANIIFSIVIPVLILNKLSSDKALGQVNALLLALAFPLGYLVFELARERKWNFISVLGMVSILLTGGLSLLNLDGFWFAIKEAAIPAMIGIVVLYSQKRNHFIIRAMVLNPKVFPVDQVLNAVETDDHKKQFAQLLDRTTQIIASSFFVSMCLNFILARVIIKSPAGTTEFNYELGRLTAYSFPVIALPSMAVAMFAIFFLFRGIHKITGIRVFELIEKHQQDSQK